MTIHRNDLILSAMLGIVAMAVATAMWPIRVDPVLKLEISRHRGGISTLDQPRDITERKVVFVDTLDLARGGRFAHARLGDIGYGSDFFVDVEREFDVATAGTYRFVVSSDDGFAIEIDGRRICAFTSQRSLTTQACAALLESGRHRFRLQYFQAGGPAGLRVDYSSQTDSRLYPFGQSSPHFRFP